MDGALGLLGWWREAEGNRDGLDSVNVAGWVAALAAFSISRVPLRFEIRHRLFACRDGAEAEASLVKKKEPQWLEVGCGPHWGRKALNLAQFPFQSVSQDIRLYGG